MCASIHKYVHIYKEYVYIYISIYTDVCYMRVFFLFICICFLICWFPLGVFEPDFAFLGASLGLLLLESFGRLGLPRGSLWRHSGLLWLPWDSVKPFGVP